MMDMYPNIKDISSTVSVYIGIPYSSVNKHALTGDTVSSNTLQMSIDQLPIYLNAVQHTQSMYIT